MKTVTLFSSVQLRALAGDCPESIRHEIADEFARATYGLPFSDLDGARQRRCLDAAGLDGAAAEDGEPLPVDVLIAA